MAAFQSHVNIVRQNTILLNGLLVPAVQQHPDWVATVAFYTALHMVEAMFYYDLPAKHICNHHDRQKELLSPRYQHIWRDYRPLYSMSRLARYLQNPTGASVASFSAHHPPHTVEQYVMQQHLPRVKDATEQIIRQHEPQFQF
jgi:hypothetical protein